MLIKGDARQLPIKGGIVQCVVTSPPYWGLRDYGTARWEGGDESCDHSPDKRGSRFATPVSAKQFSNTGSGTASRRDCDCGARRRDSQIGLESTPEAYVAELVAVFREVWRVLRKDGTVWLVLGDSYAANRSYQVRDNKHVDVGNEMAMAVPLGLKPKDLVGIPWRVAFALQADGWYLRSDIIWSKPNPMPESVTDRPTKAHEYVFLLTKSERYYYDAEAIKETAIDTNGGLRFYPNRAMAMGRPATGNEREGMAGIPRPDTRNRRSVWEVATESYNGAHFATFPRKLIEPMILAGSKPGDIVFDPFCGTGTTQSVARELGRMGIGVDLKYQELAANRIAGGPLLSGLVNAAPLDLRLEDGW